MRGDLWPLDWLLDDLVKKWVSAHKQVNLIVTDRVTNVLLVRGICSIFTLDEANPVLLHGKIRNLFDFEPFFSGKVQV